VFQMDRLEHPGFYATAGLLKIARSWCCTIPQFLTDVVHFSVLLYSVNLDIGFAFYDASPVWCLRYSSVSCPVSVFHRVGGFC